MASDTKVSDLTATTTPVSTDIVYLVDGGASRQATLGNISKGIVVTSLDVTGLTASQLLRVNSGVTAIESSGKTVPTGDIVGTSDTQTLTNKTLTTPIIASLYQDAGKTKLMTVPNTASDTLAAIAATQTLTNKTLTSPSMTTPSITSGDVNLATGLNIQVNSADPDRIISLPAGSWEPTTTSGCAVLATVEAGTNDIDYRVLDFDTGSDENAFTNFQMPTSYDGGVIQFRYVWTNAGGGAAETVVFELSGRAYADNDAIDQAVSTPAIEVSDTWIAQGDIHISAWSADVTLAGTPAGGQWVHLEIMRDISEDDLTGDARLIEVQIKYKQSQYGE